MHHHELLDPDAQPICPHCGVTMHPEDGADECRECGHRVPWSGGAGDARDPGDDEWAADPDGDHDWD